MEKTHFKLRSMEETVIYKFILWIHPIYLCLTFNLMEPSYVFLTSKYLKHISFLILHEPFQIRTGTILIDNQVLYLLS